VSTPSTYRELEDGMYANVLDRYEQLTLRANSLREELHTEIERMLDDIVRFKLHIQRNLEEYEVFIADEVEKSCEEQDMLGDAEDVAE
jgi:kinetochore protein NDC80